MRRNDIDICADILKVARGGAKKTHLVYRANLNFNVIKKYLRKLMDTGFLESEDGRYFTTEDGARFLERYKEFVAPFYKDMRGDYW